MFSSLEDSFHLAFDTGINDVITCITGYLNFNLLNNQQSRNTVSLCRQFSLHQTTSEPTHFTESSSSLLDPIFISNKKQMVESGVGDPFLSQNIRYHSPIFGIIKFSKPKLQSFKRHI